MSAHKHNAGKPKLSFQFSDTDIKEVNGDVVQAERRRSAAAALKHGRQQGPLEAKAYQNVYKILNDPISQRHVILQRQCMRALDNEKKHELSKDPQDETLSSLEPIVDICLINSAKEEAPPGWEVLATSPDGLPCHVLRGTGCEYLLCIRRAATIAPPRSLSVIIPALASAARPSVDDKPTPGGPAASGAAVAEENSEQHLQSAISDIRVVKKDEVPFGYIPILQTLTGSIIYSPTVLCYSRNGLARIQSVCIMHPAAGEKVPSGYIIIKSNLNEGSAEKDKDAFLCIAKDFSTYFSEMLQHADQLPNDPKFLLPLLTACHIQEPVLGTVALMSLHSLVIDGYFSNTKSSLVLSQCLSSVVVASCDALATSYEPNFQKAVVSLLRGILKQHYLNLSLADIFEMSLASSHVVSSTLRNIFLESLADTCIRAPGAGVSHTPSSAGGLSQHGGNDFFYHLLQNIVENITHGKLSGDLLYLFQTLPVFSADFRQCCLDVANLLFDHVPQRKLAVLTLFLCKSALVKDSTFGNVAYKYGLARKHSALFVVQHILAAMSHHTIKHQFTNGNHDNGKSSRRADDEKTPQDSTVPSATSSFTERDFADMGSSPASNAEELVAPLSHPRLSSTLMTNPNRLFMDRSFAFLLRRFLVTTLCTSLVPDPAADNTTNSGFADPRTFKHVLGVTSILWRHHVALFKTEVGTLLDKIFFELARHPLTPQTQKQDILDAMSEMMDAPQHLLNLFYNYDNRGNWFIFEGFVTLLGTLIEDAKPRVSSLEDDASAQASEGEMKMVDQARSRGKTVEFDAQINSVDQNTSAATVQPPTQRVNKSVLARIIGNTNSRLTPKGHLLMNALDVLVTLLRGVDDWHRIQYSAKSQQELLKFRNMRSPAGGNGGGNGGGSGSRNSLQVGDLSQKELHEAVRRRVKESRKGTVMKRFNAQKENKKVMERALRIAREKSLAKAMQHLEALEFIKHDAAAISEFCYKMSATGKLTWEIVGEYLGGKRPKDEAPFEEAVRMQYIRRLHFANITLEVALRRFLTESMFRLPPEAQKIERLLESFALSYHLENPNVFRDEDGPFILATAILMLNTSLHNKNLRDSDRMTENGFVKMCGAIEGSSYTPDDLRRVYADIKNNGYEIALTEHVRKKATSPLEEKSRMHDVYAAKVRGSVRIALAELKHGELYQPTFFQAMSEETALSLFESTWFHFMKTLSSVLESAVETRTVTTCINGFKFALRLCVRLGLGEERKALAMSLAKFTHLSSNRLSESPKSKADMNREIVTGKHAKQGWLVQIIQLNEADGGVDMVTTILDNLKKKYIRETNFQVLREIQTRLASDVQVAAPGRYFIREGNVDKVSLSNSNRRTYRMFLFSDALLYAEASGTKFKVHRVLMLAFASVIPYAKKSLRNAFKVISPQKTILIQCDTAQSRDAWVESIDRNIQQQQKRRKQIIDSANRLANDGIGLSQSDVVSLTNTAAFLGVDTEDIKRGDITPKNVDHDRCRLCARQYSFFSGRQTCKRCQMDICGACFQKKIIMSQSKTKTRVCDGCFGLTKQFEVQRCAESSI